jgi:hypothetical protein
MTLQSSQPSNRPLLYLRARALQENAAAGNSDVLTTCSSSSERLALWRSAYNDLVSTLSIHFDHESDWWFVPLSTRDHFGSRLQERFQQVARLERTLAHGNGPATVACEDGLFAASLAEFFGQRGWEVKRPMSDRLIWISRDARRRMTNAARLGLRVARLWRDWWAGRKQNSWVSRTSGLDAIFVAPMHLPVRTSPDNVVRDDYFGDLPRKFADAGKRVAVTGPLIFDPFDHARAAQKLRRVPVVALDSMITLGDVAALGAGALRRWLRPPRVPVKVDGPLPRMRGIVQREIDDAIVSRVHGAHLERAFRKLLSRSPGVRVLHTYENNWWERAIDRPAAGRAESGEIVGYLHCAVLESSLKNFRRNDEIARPQPDRIICTGPAARTALLTLGEYDPDKVFAGCALRAPDLDALPGRKGAIGTARSILVLLEGLPTMAELVRLVAKAAPALAGRRIVVRPHPVLPLEQIAAKAGVRIAADGLLQPSSGAPLVDEIAAADLVIFKASSAALIAGYAGLPLIRYRDDWWLSDDPLRHCDALKVEVGTPDQIVAAVERFESMSADELDDERARFRAYIDSYLARPSDAALACFNAK